MDVIEIYTDGACRGNPGPGGWGVLFKKNGGWGLHSSLSH